MWCRCEFIVLCALYFNIHCVDINDLFENKRNELDPEIFLNSPQLIQKYNYPAETHRVQTRDGYLLNLYRIPRGGRPVLLVHGIGDSSDSWLVLGPGSSLAFLLADSGYDVWLFNARGNKYSKKHLRNISLEDYWNFSYEEIGTEDLSATVDYILSRTHRSKLTYVGYSQGTTIFFVLCSTKPEYNNKIDYAILLAPVAWLGNMKHPLVPILSRNLKEFTTFFRNAKIYEAFPYNERNNIYHAKVCNITSPINILCGLEIYKLFGLNSLNDLTPERLPIITSHTRAGFSIKTLLHYLQANISKRFRRFDNGEKANKLIYSSPAPPDFDVSLISVPMTMIASEVDWYASPKDVAILNTKLKSRRSLISINETMRFTHLEFVYGSRVKSLINSPILNILREL